MKIPEANDEIQKTFLTCWASGNYPDTPVLWSNDDMDTPNNESWVRISIKYNTSRQNTIGRKTRRRFGRYGFVSFQVFVMGGTGTYTGNYICQEILDILEGEDFSSINFENGQFSETGKEDVWFQYNGTIDFWFEETK